MTLIGQRMEILLNVISNSKQVSDYAKEFPRRHWSFLGPGNEEMVWTYAHEPEGKCDQQANQMVDQFHQNGHSFFQGTCALDRGVLKRKSGRKLFTSRRTRRTLN